MKKLAIAISLWIASISCALAENEAAELGHHWSNPVYLGEMRYQVVMITLVIAAIYSISRYSRRRSNR